MSELAAHFHDLADRAHAAITQGCAPIECPLIHTFTPGPAGSGVQLYGRSITMPAGAWIVSEQHEVEHQFNVSRGVVEVRSPDGIELISAPYCGVTLPGTRRILFVHKETVWTTYHIIPDTMSDPAEIVKHVTAPRSFNPYLESAQKEELQ